MWKIKRVHTTIWGRLILVSLIAICSGWWGWMYGFYSGTGIFPYSVEAQMDVLPPPIQADIMESQVHEFVAEDTTDLNVYDIGFNCVEYAFLMARNAHWKGLPAEAVRIDLDSGIQHLILAFPTRDTGWIFIDPKTETFLKPRIGGKLGEETIVGLYILRAEWVPFEEVIAR